MDTSLLPLLSFAGIASALGAIAWGIRDLGAHRAQSALQRELRKLPRLTPPDDKAGALARFDYWFEKTLYMSGLGLRPLDGALLLILTSLAAGGSVFVFTENGLFTAAAAAVAVVLTMLFILYRKRQRMQKFQEQFPGALDLLARAVRAGESLEQALSLVGQTAHDPVGPEFRRCAKQLDMGLALPACMTALATRLDLMDVKIFCNTLAVHRSSGGNLPVTLERLAEVIRDRSSYHRQLRSVTGAGRYSAILISVLGPILFAYLFLFQPEYGNRLLSDPMGRWLLLFAIVSQVVGLVWVVNLVKSEY